MTIRANYSGNPDNLLGTAPVYYVQPQEEEETVRFAFIVPSLQIPISTPVAVRTGVRLRPQVQRLGPHPDDPAGRRRADVWGFPAAAATMATVSQRLARLTGRMSRRRRHELRPGPARPGSPTTR